MFALFLVQSWNANCQSTTTETICKPENVFRNLLAIAKQKEVQDTLIALYRSDIAIMGEQIRTHRIKDSLQAQMAGTYQSIINTQTQQRQALEGQIGVLNKEVRKWKRKTTWTGIGGIALTLITTALFIFK